MKKIGLFAAGALFGTAGIKLLSSKDARKAYAHTTADAKAINERRAEAEATVVVEDASAEESKAE